jgi:uncharacterized protein
MKNTMTPKLIKQLRTIAEERQMKDDPSHDFGHVHRVFLMATKIGESVNADLDVVLPAALFHDTVVYKKDSPQSLNEANESAEVAGEILSTVKGFPKEKIENVKTCIRECSFTKGITAKLLESQVLQDADLLESVGAISIMRTFSSCGHMNRAFYNKKHPFYEKHEKDFPSGIGLFYRRLLAVEPRLHTKLAKKIGKQRTLFLKKFLNQFEKELKESGVIL